MKYSSSLRFSGRGSRLRRVDGQIAPGVEHLDRAEMFCGRGVIEQDQLAQLLADIADLRHLKIAGDRAQRQVVKLDVAADVGLDARRQILQGAAGQFLLAAAHIEHHAGADRGEAEDGRNRRRDQQLCR
ncbi:hypothetical protein ABIA28_001571 [Bradyrhizobium elkanii]